jgi:hypothetical protein
LVTPVENSYLDKLSKFLIRVVKNLECTMSLAHEAYSLGH